MREILTEFDVRNAFWAAVGAFMGLILTITFEDRLKVRFERFVRRLRRRTGRYPDYSRNCFRLGPIVTDCLILEGDGENVIEEESVYVAVNPTPLDLPAEIEHWRTEVEVAEAEKRAAGEPWAWNGENYAVERFNVSRTAIDEKPEIYIRFRHCDFYTFMAAQQVDRPMTDGVTPRQKFILDRRLDEVPAFMSCSFGVNIVVITRDNQIIFSRRSQSVAFFPGLWSVSANEAVSRSIDSRGRGAPNLYGVARRGLQEELGLNADEYDLNMLAVHLATTKHLWGCDFIARVKSVSAEQLQDRWTRGRPDPWEHNEHLFLRFTPEAVLGFIVEKHSAGQLTSMAPAIYYLALVNEFGRDRIEKEASRVARRMVRRTTRRLR